MQSARFLEEEKVMSLLWKFSVPAVAGMVVGALYNVVDSIFVGNGVGEIALTAVTIAFPIMTMLMALGMLIGVGSAAMISLLLGQKKQDAAEMVLGNALTLMIILILASTAAALYFLDPMLVDVMGVTPEVLPYAHDFTEIILLGSVFMHVGFGLNNLIRAQGDPKTALQTQLIAAVVNIVLNYLLVFVIPWGIRGSAIATVLAQATAAVWVMYYFTAGPGLLHFKWHCLRLRWPVVHSICKIGMAPFTMQVAASVVMVILNVRIQTYGGVTAVAVYGIINRVMMLALMPVVGISQGAQPIIGYNYGAKKFERVIKALKLAIMWATVVCTAGFLAAELFAQPLIRTFNESPQLVEVGMTGMRIYLAMIPLVGIQIVGSNYFQAIGKAYFSVALTLSRQIGLLIPLVLILSHYFGLFGIWFAGPGSDLGATVLTVLFLSQDIRGLKRQMEKSTLNE